MRFVGALGEDGTDHLGKERGNDSAVQRRRAAPSGLPRESGHRD